MSDWYKPTRSTEIRQLVSVWMRLEGDDSEQRVERHDEDERVARCPDVVRDGGSCSHDCEYSIRSVLASLYFSMLQLSNCSSSERKRAVQLSVALGTMAWQEGPKQEART